MSEDPFGPASPFPHVSGAFMNGGDYLERGDARLAGRTRDEDHRRVHGQADQILEHVAQRRAELVPHAGEPDISTSTTSSSTSTSTSTDDETARFVAMMHRERFAR